MQLIVGRRNKYETEVIDMPDIIEINRNDLPNLEKDASELLCDEVGLSTERQKISIPIAQMAGLGAGVASLIPALRSITQTTTIPADGLYRLANAAVGDTLKVAKNGNFWGALKTAEGTSKFAQLQAAESTTVSTKTVMAIDPATIMMAVALFSIEQKLGSIVELEKKVLSFLEADKEAGVEADMQTLTGILKKYKLGWDNEHFIASNHKLAIDIQRTARKNILAYQKQVADILNSKKWIVSQSKVDESLKDLLRKFRFYRLSIYGFALSSLVEILLSGDFKEENILCAKEEIRDYSISYRELYSAGSLFLEKLSNASIKANVMKGIGIAGKATGKFIEKIPVIKDGSVDEFLQGGGEQLQKQSEDLKKRTIAEFAEISDPKTTIFTEQMEQLIQIYGRTQEICFDSTHIHLVAG